jgi:mannose-6-phosphate isomerase
MDGLKTPGIRLEAMVHEKDQIPGNASLPELAKTNTTSTRVVRSVFPMANLSHRDPALSRLVAVLPTRVRRNYRGGMLLDRLEGSTAPVDSDRPESWIASTIEASNPGLPPLNAEGLTRVRLAVGAAEMTLAALVARAPAFYLGERHVETRGTQLGFLAKLLDSSMRLHVQAHPTSVFARERLGAPFGKLEVYHVLAVRGGVEGFIRLGFQRSPGRDRWKRIIEEQDIAAMDACFDPIPVKPGETWMVPGGLPHAIGGGVLMVEVMEPSDLVVRCEFEREGVIVPSGGRFIGRGLDFCLDVFDYAEYSSAEIRRRFCLESTHLVDEPGWVVDCLVGSERTGCFEICRIQADRTGGWANGGRCALAIATSGSGVVVAGDEQLALAFGGSCFVAAANSGLTFSPGTSGGEILLCQPAATAR